MSRFYRCARALVLASFATVLIGGCPDVARLADVGPTPTEPKEVFRILGETVSTAELNSMRFSEQTQLALDEPANFGEAEVLFQTVPFEDIELSEDAILSEVSVTDDGGLVIAHGGLAGRFLNDIPDSHSDLSSGCFRGRWFSANGEVRGVVRGEYRPLPPENLPPGLAGGGIFHGKYIDIEGRFRGFLRGRYGHRPDRPGYFFGRWLGRHQQLIGVLGGRWQDDPNFNGGTFRGRWAAFNICDEADSLLEMEPNSTEELSADILAELSADDEELDRLATANDLRASDDVSVLDEPDVVLAGGPPCIEPGAPYGFLRGWHRPQPPEDPNEPGPPHGVFHGRWRAANGDVLGRLAGRYVAIDEPPQEPPLPGVRGHFRGRYVGSSGNIDGFLLGVYGGSPHGLAVFHGRYFDVDGNPLGVLRGRWHDAPQQPGGPFFGGWVGVNFGGSDPNEPGS
jgi:hypothetical protein